MVTLPVNSAIRPWPFTYTAGRYIFNEKIRFAERYVEFNIEALKQWPQGALAGPQSFKSNWRKVDSTESSFVPWTMALIAKIPYPLTVPKMFTTDSEVAMLDLPRKKGRPVSQAHAYSSESNNVGTEYMIMEKAAGQPVDCRWFDLTPKERVYVEIDRKLFSIPFVSYGSLYYKHSVPPELQCDLYWIPGDHEGWLCKGTLADYMLWRERSAKLEQIDLVSTD